MCDAAFVALQALPGSRLDTNLLKEWLLQHLHSLHTIQSHVAAAETASCQKQHAAAAAAAARAVHATLEAAFQDDERDDSSAEGLVAAGPAQRMATEHEEMQWRRAASPTQLVGTTVTNAAGSVSTQGNYQVQLLTPSETFLQQSI